MTRTIDADTPVATRFREVAAMQPDAIALVSPHASWTYAELDRWSDAIAASIVAAGASSTAPVAIIAREHISLVPASLGAVKAGFFFVIVDASDPADRIASILDTSGAALCLLDRQASPPPTTLPTLRLCGLPHEAVPAPARAPHELVQLVFTSGTTGAPKAVATRQRAFVERLVRASARTGRAAGERVSYTAMPGHARATGEIFGSLLNGATLCAFDARTDTLATLADLIERERISILTLTPALFRRFMRTLPARANLSSVRKLRIGADVITVADVDAWRARFPRTTTLERAFNSTETGMVLHISIEHDTPVPGPLVPIGRPVTGVDVWLVDEEGNEVADGETGELIVRGASVAHGYWNAPELTAQKFTFEDPERPTFRTGDLVRRDADGLYYFVGRRDARLKIHGRRIDPVEVESALVLHAGVREAVAIAERTADGEARLAAFVVTDAADTRDIRAALRGKLPAWMIPARIYTIDTLPMTPSGKVDREALAQRAASSAGTGADGSPDQDLLEKTRAIWSRVLNTHAAPDDDFFALGGDSLSAAEIVAEINRLTGRALPLSLLLELNTVRKMADYLRARPELEHAVVAVQPNGSHPPLFCVSGKGGSVIVFRKLARHLGKEQPFYGLTYHGIALDSFPTSLAAIAACYVDAIRAKQPHGPYYLAGYSAGGIIAFEMARQLSRAGETVAFTGLLDSAAASQGTGRTRHLLAFAQVALRHPFFTALRLVRAFGRRILWLYLWLERGRKGSFVPAPPPELAPITGFYDRLEMYAALQPYSGPVTLFLAKQGRGADCAAADAGWTAYTDQLEIINTPGSHLGILNEDAASLARPLAAALAKARAANGVTSS